MCLTPHSIRRVDGGLVIEGLQGAVRIRRRMNHIETSYQGDQLVNGSAAAYSEQLLEQAIELTARFPFPWHLADDGTQHITDHQRYYEQTFMPHLQGIETLKYWMHECPDGSLPSRRRDEKNAGAKPEA